MDQPQKPRRPDAVSADDDDGPLAPPPADAPPLGPVEWIRVNGPLLLLLLAGVVWLWARTGPYGIWKAFLVVIGIGFVIFIHELGHFLAAKWCDVHVTTFSIGFGPAIPGLSFRRGETLYKVALLPLGGYVNMVGEGSEADEDESYPRSFKNKTVGQRMLIISAGVVMNVLLGLCCYIIVYRFHGELRLPAILGSVQPGSPAWKGGVHSAMRIDEINGRKNPYWDNLTIDVASAPAGKPIPFVFEDTEHDKTAVELTPRLDPTDDKPLIGVGQASRLRLYAARPNDDAGHPSYRLQSAAAYARVVDLRPGDRVLAASDPKGGDGLTDLPAKPGEALLELGRRMRALEGKALSLKVRHKDGGTETVSVPPEGFTFEDQIIGTTDPASADPLVVKELPPDPFPDPTATKGLPDESSADEPRDFFEYQKRMKQLAGKPALVQVRRKGTPGNPGPLVTVFVPPAYHQTLGLRMTFGKVTAVRTGSPAEQAGVQEGDQITKVVLVTKKGRKEFRAGEVDPVKLPGLLAEEAARSDGPTQAVISVIRPDKRKEEKQLEPVAWAAAWDYYDEPASVPRAPQSVPQLGLAYLVVSTVTKVDAGSPANLAGAVPGDTVIGIRFRRISDKKGETPEWGEWADLKAKARFDPGDASEQWAYVETALQSRDDYDVQLKVQGRDDKIVYLPGRDTSPPTTAIRAVDDPAWPLAERGLLFQPDFRLQKAANTVTAIVYGGERTLEFIRQIYLNLRAVVSGRVSTKTFNGPIPIAATAFAAAEDPFTLLLFLGVISVNLAVVNFLPIPVLDGGHMVFLIYEKLRGRRPSETVQTVATIAGIVFLISLMLFITYQDVRTLGLFDWVKKMWPGKG